MSEQSVPEQVPVEDVAAGEVPAAESGGGPPVVPSATVDADVAPHGGQPAPEQRTDGTYVDGNLDTRGDVAAGVPQSSYEEYTLDADADTTLRTDGTGRHPDEAADASVPDDEHR